MQNHCAEIKVRAERRGGELLKQMEPNNAGRDHPSHDVIAAPTLKDIGVSKKQSFCWQAIWSMPEVEFERYIEEAKAKPNGELTTAALLKQAKAIEGTGKQEPIPRW